MLIMAGPPVIMKLIQKKLLLIMKLLNKRTVKEEGEAFALLKRKLNQKSAKPSRCHAKPNLNQQRKRKHYQELSKKLS